MNWNPGSGSRREFIRLWSWPISNYMRFPSCWQNQLLISRGGSWACILLSTISCSIWKHSIKKKNLTNLKVYTQSRYHIYPKAFFFMHESYAVPCTAAILYLFPLPSFPVSPWKKTFHQNSLSLCNSKIGNWVSWWCDFLCWISHYTSFFFDFFYY